MASPYAAAIASIESGGSKDPYRLLGPVTRTGDQAHGKYQVMGANIGPWSQEVLGRRLTPQEFLDDGDAQDQIFESKFDQYHKKTGSPQDAASMWFTGKPLAQGTNRRDVLGTSGNDYVAKFNRALGSDTPMAQAFASGQPEEIVPFQRRPLPGALSAPNVAGPSALYPEAQPQADPSLLDRVTSQEGLNGIERAGVYLSGITDPKALGALGAIGPKAGRYSVQRDERTGAIFTIDNQTGRSVRTQDPSWTGEKVDAGTLKSLGEDNKGYGQLQGVTERAKYFQDKIQNGELDLGLASKGKAAWESLNGSTSPQSQLYNEFEAFKTELANAHLLVAKGTQTEGDAQRARQEFASGLASLDKNTTVKQLDNIIAKHGRVIADGKMQLDSLSAGINNPAVFSPYQERFKTYDKFYKDHEGSIARRAAPAATVPANGAVERRSLGDIFKK